MTWHLSEQSLLCQQVNEQEMWIVIKIEWKSLQALFRSFSSRCLEHKWTCKRAKKVIQYWNNHAAFSSFDFASVCDIHWNQMLSCRMSLCGHIQRYWKLYFLQNENRYQYMSENSCMLWNKFQTALHKQGSQCRSRHCWDWQSHGSILGTIS